MLGTNGRPPPSGTSAFHRNLWPPLTANLAAANTLQAGRATFEIQANGEVTESLFTAGGYNPPPANTTTSFIPVAPLELVAKNFHSGTVAFSQVPPLTSIANHNVKAESLSSQPASRDSYQPSTSLHNSVNHNNNSINNNNSHKPNPFNENTTTSLIITPSISNAITTTTIGGNELVNAQGYGCRTIPLTWTTHQPQAQSQPPPLFTNHVSNVSTASTMSTSTGNGSSIFTTNSLIAASGTADSTTKTTRTTLLQIKREPCQVSEITTSNNLCTTPTLSAIVKIEQNSPKSTATMDTNCVTTAQSTAGIPVGIAVARQRLQETQCQSPLQPKDIGRFGLGFSDLGCGTPSLSQNMFFAGTHSTMIPLSSEAVTMGVSNVSNAVRTPPTLWQYPTQMPVESMLPMSSVAPPVGFQLVRDPSTGQFLFLPTTTTTIEPYQPQALVWPYQAAAAMQPPHLLIPPLTTQQLQPPPLAPLQILGSDYLTTASTTLHQHTQTHSTRLVALTDTKRKTANQPNSTSGQSVPLPLPMPSHTLIKIEDCSGGGLNSTVHTSSHNQSLNHSAQRQSTVYEQEKSIQTSHQTIATSMPAQLFYPHHGGLIQIAPPPAQQQQTQTTTILEATTTECRAQAPLPPLVPTMMPALTDGTPLTPPPDQPLTESETTMCTPPEVQDANIQTDDPMLSEDDDCSQEASMMEEQSQEEDGDTQPEDLRSANTIEYSASADYEKLCHSIMNSSTETRPEDVEQASASVQEPVVTTAAEPVIESPVQESLRVVRPKMEVLTPEKEMHHEFPEPSVADSAPDQDPTPLPAEQLAPVDLSGLELLSHSIEVFQKKRNIKVEPIEQLSPVAAPAEPQPMIVHEQPPPMAPAMMTYNNNNNDDQLGGLNLLCALAEQRFHEEVDQRNNKKDTSASSVEDFEATPSDTKKRKHKHSSSKKSSKKSKHDRDKSRKRKHSSDEGEDVGKEVENTLKRIKAKYNKCSCPGRDEIDHKCTDLTVTKLFSEMESEMIRRLNDIERQCQKKKRELDEMKSRKDTEVRPAPLLGGSGISVRSEESLKTGFFGGKISQKLSTIPALSPNFSTSSNSNSTLIEIPKLSSDTESSGRFEDGESSSHSKRGGDLLKKPKSLVGYIVASKNRANDSQKERQRTSDTIKKGHFGSSPSMDPVSDYLEKSFRNKATIKAEPLSSPNPDEEIYDVDKYKEDDYQSMRPVKAFTIFGDNPFSFDKKQTHRSATVSKHHSKHKKSKDKMGRKHRSERRKIDARCTLTADHLDRLEGEKIRVLTAMGGLYYAGTLNPLQPPDIYSITLDGERGNRPHILSREEILRDAIVEVAPQSVSDVPIGTRLCAYWSQQYRCLYPGTAAAPVTPDPENVGKYVNVEFDDGDNGRIALEDIRYLLSDCPIVEYDPNPLSSLNKRIKRRTSHTDTELTPSAPAHVSTTSNIVYSVQKPTATISSSSSSHHDAYREERRRMKKIRRDKQRQLAAAAAGGTECDSPRNNTSPDGTPETSERKHKKKHKCVDEFCKHRRHKKRRKHKKHHHREDSSSATTPELEVSRDESLSHHDSMSPEEEITQDDSVSQTGNFEVVVKKGDTDEMDEKPVMMGEDKKREKFEVDEDVASSVTESSGSIYQPKKVVERKKSSSESCSKIAAFLPARQLWAWSGKGYKRSAAKGRVKKQFFRSIQRGKETISVGDSAVFLSTGRPDRPYIGHIESMWESNSNQMVVRVKWFYHPEETEGCPNLKYPGALFESPHEDENDVQTISHKCEVLAMAPYINKFGTEPKQYQSIYDNNDTYYLAGYYDPTQVSLKMEPNIAVLKEDEKWM